MARSAGVIYLTPAERAYILNWTKFSLKMHEAQAANFPKEINLKKVRKCIRIEKTVIEKMEGSIR